MYPALIVFAVVFLLRVLICMFQYLQSVKTPRQVELEEGMKALKASLASLSGGSADFVAKSKLEREYNRVEKELNYLLGKQKVYAADGKALPPPPPPLDVASYLTTYAQPAALLALVALYWSTPMAYITTGTLWPLGWFYLSKGGSELGVTMWVFASYSAASRGVPQVFKVLGLTPEKEAQSLMQSIMGFFK